MQAEQTRVGSLEAGDTRDPVGNKHDRCIFVELRRLQGSVWPPSGPRREPGSCSKQARRDSPQWSGGCASSIKTRCPMPQSSGHAIFARREFFRRTGVTLGGVAAASLLGQLAMPACLSADGGGLTPRTPPLPAKAKAIIHIFAAGAP